MKVASDSGSIVSFLLNKVSNLEATNRVLAENGGVMRALLTVQDTKMDNILSLLQEKCTPLRTQKRSLSSQSSKEMEESSISCTSSSSSSSLSSPDETVQKRLCQGAAVTMPQFAPQSPCHNTYDSITQHL